MAVCHKLLNIIFETDLTKSPVIIFIHFGMDVDTLFIFDRLKLCKIALFLAFWSLISKCKLSFEEYLRWLIYGELLGIMKYTYPFVEDYTHLHFCCYCAFTVTNNWTVLGLQNMSCQSCSSDSRAFNFLSSWHVLFNYQIACGILMLDWHHISSHYSHISAANRDNVYM